MTIHSGGAPLHIANGIREFAAAQPDTPAVIDGERVITYAELEDRSNRIGQALLATGLPKGTTVAVLLGNRAEYMEIAAGIARAGMVMVPLNPRMTHGEVEFIVDHSECRALFLDDAHAAVAEPTIDRFELVVSIDGTDALAGARNGVEHEQAIRDAAPEPPQVEVAETDPFCIAYTSGTTGRPKGVVISHRSRTLTFYCCALDWNIGVGKRSVAVAPMYHGAGFCFGYAPVATGGTVSMLRSFDPEELLRIIERDKANSVFLVPTHAQMLRALGEDVIGRHDLSSLDTFYFNAAALPVALKEWVMATFPHVGVHELYGSTEAGIMTNLRPKDALRKPGSVGTPWFMQEIRVVDDNGDPVAPGEPGELFSRSPFIMNGYLKDEEATAGCTTPDGFITCGDIVVVDEEGYVRIVDRKKDMIISGGVNVYPRDVEEVLVTHDAIAEAAVVGVPDEKWGERVVAYVTLRGDRTVDLEEVDAFLRPHLAGFKIPRELHVIDALPRNAGGKVLKRELRDRHVPG